jgi:urease accessory protein
MLQFTRRADAGSTVAASVTLPIEKREKSRLRVTLSDGREAGIVLDRGEFLQHGDKLATADGETIEVIAAEESLSIVRCHDALLFARACYHLGNRHVPVQIVVTEGVGTVSYLHDHVLDDMLRGLGLQVDSAMAAFNPEPGAYGGGHHPMHHGHSH